MDYISNTELAYRRKGRVITGWWDGQPIHREMTSDERAVQMRIDPLTLRFALRLLGNRDYKPHYELH